MADSAPVPAAVPGHPSPRSYCSPEGLITVSALLPLQNHSAFAEGPAVPAYHLYCYNQASLAISLPLMLRKLADSTPAPLPRRLAAGPEAVVVVPATPAGVSWAGAWRCCLGRCSGLEVGQGASAWLCFEPAGE